MTVGDPLINLLGFALAVAAAAGLFAPRWGVLRALRRKPGDRERIRLEDTLKYVYDHEYRGETATLDGLTAGLGVSAADGAALVGRMERAGLVSVADGRVVLSEQGRRYALQVIRAHRLWERYLADETGVAPVRWHVEAERREHSLSPDEADALSRSLGNPRYDPHGDPIPTTEGEMPVGDAVPLARLGRGDAARIVHMEDEPPAVYAQLVALGFYVGMEFRVASSDGDRIVVVTEDGREIVLAPAAAENVSIERVARREWDDLGRAHETLASLASGEAAEVLRISPACRGLERRRLMDLGILPGTRIEYDRRGMTGGLTSYRVRDTVIALRREQAEMIAIHHRERLAS